MDERDWLAERFEEHRTRLRAVAYRMLGSLSEADDAVQEDMSVLDPDVVLRADLGPLPAGGSREVRGAAGAGQALTYSRLDLLVQQLDLTILDN
jgi:hypothetical protein